MHEYRPPFTDPHVESVARRRGLLAADESLLDGLERVAQGLAILDEPFSNGADTFAAEMRDALLSGRIGVSSQLFAAVGRSTDGAACTVLPVIGATDGERVRRSIAEATYASEMGMGCGLDLTQFDDPAASAVAINSAMRQVHARLVSNGARPPALMLTCSSTHPKIDEFISVKRDADFSKWVANISVRVSGSDHWQRLRPIIATAAHSNGEPGVLFQDMADIDNATPQIALTSTAPCAEVFLSPGERCVFVSVNLAAHVAAGTFDWDAFRTSVRLAVRMGDAGVELASQGAPPVVPARRRIGVGVCGYHSALIRLRLPYALSADFASSVSETLTYTAHRASADLAIERGPFPLFNESRWTDRTWVTRKASRQAGAVTSTEWSALADDVVTTGVRNVAVVAYPPTGVVAELLGVSRSYEPHFTLVGRTGVASTSQLALAAEVRDELSARGDLGEEAARLIMDPSTGHQLPDALANEVLACARQIPPDVHLDVHAAFSLMADEAGSKTVNLPTTATATDVEVVLDRACALKLKGITVFRDGCLSEGTYAA